MSPWTPEYKRLIRKQRKRLGLCYTCGRPVYGGTTACFEHYHAYVLNLSPKKKQQINAAVRRHKAKIKTNPAYCSRCYRKKDPLYDAPYKTCMQCRTKHRRNSIVRLNKFLQDELYKLFT